MLFQACFILSFPFTFKTRLFEIRKKKLSLSLLTRSFLIGNYTNEIIITYNNNYPFKFNIPRISLITHP